MAVYMCMYTVHIIVDTCISMISHNHVVHIMLKPAALIFHYFKRDLFTCCVLFLWYVSSTYHEP